MCKVLLVIGKYTNDKNGKRGDYFRGKNTPRNRQFDKNKTHAKNGGLGFQKIPHQFAKISGVEFSSSLMKMCLYVVLQIAK